MTIRLLLSVVACLGLKGVTGFATLNAPHRIETRLSETKSDNPTGLNVFTGGAFDGEDDEAAKIASKIRSVKDLGWTQAAKRKGNVRPRHRAFGGAGELAVQLKPNYDESSPMCVEKWLSQEEFNAKVRNESPAADAVFCALAGGAAFAERDNVEQKLNQWRGNNGKFDKAAFLKTVQQGRTELALGYGLFLSITGFAAISIAFPTNPAAMAGYDLLDAVRGEYNF